MDLFDLHGENDLNTDLVVELLRSCPGLSAITLYRCGEVVLPKIASPLPTSLKNFAMDVCSEQLLANVFKSCTNLQSLDLRECEQISDAFLETAGFPSSLKTVILHNRHDSKILQNVCKRCPNLEKLVLSHCKELASALESAELPPTIVKFGVEDMLLPPKSIENIFKRCVNIRKIKLERSPDVQFNVLFKNMLVT